jgi:hypothetical protein
MDLVYLFKGGSKTELFLSIKSAWNFLKGYRHIYVVGDYVNFPTVKVIMSLQNGTNRYNNSYLKLVDACNYSDISDDFILMNDDFIFLKPLHVNDLSNYYIKDQIESLSNNLNDTRNHLFKNTVDYLKSKNKPLNHFDVHFPMVINKNNFLSMPSDKEYAYRSLYGNLFYKKLKHLDQGDNVCKNLKEFNIKLKTFSIISTHDNLIKEAKINVVSKIKKLFSSKIYISMTSVPSRFTHLPEIIKNLKLQTTAFEKIILNIPKEYKRYPGEHILPEEIINDEKVYINYIDVDLGPISKIIPVKDLDFINNMDLIFTVDDDVEYSSNLLQKFVKEFEREQNEYVITGRGLSIKNNKAFGDIKPITRFLQGFSGCLYRKAYIKDFSEEYINIILNNRESFVSDDIILSLWLEKQNIKIKNLKLEKNKEVKPLNFGLQEDRLSIERTSDVKVYVDAAKQLNVEI